ncbi:glycosyltransferase family 2 protein [Laspinema sp. A4]|uniref:glycosyltransferase family 2 protein n=1 Tax=Laspinema sp. D2d TaxID=2953686 RepID=UPI0021BB2E07|nr:glycosyltransferase family A protein [Laspinema sp. D2d]MCT7984817.1 glycosyltransferase family 2 protein [Laspinema sp. D2d]
MSIISIVIPAYNAEKTLLKTLNSVQTQTFGDWEALVIDDGSTDSTAQIVKELHDPRINVFSYPHAGLAAARNHGIINATGDYIAFLDADDLWTTDKLELQLKALQDHPEAGVAYSWNYFQYENPADSYEDTSQRFQGNVYGDLLVKNFIQNGSNPLVRKEAIASVGLFDPSLKSCEDWEYYLRLAKQWHFVLVPQVQVFYRKSSTSLTSKIEVMETYLRLVIDRAFQSAPPELQYLKSQSLSWVAQYIAEHYLKSKQATLKQLFFVGFNLCKTIYLHPSHASEAYTHCLIRMFLKQLFLRVFTGRNSPQETVLN